MRHAIGHVLIIGGLIGMYVCRICILLTNRKLRWISRAEIAAAYERIRQTELRTAEINAELECIRAETARIRGRGFA